MASKKRVGAAGTGTALVLAGAALVEKGNLTSGIVLVIAGLALIVGIKWLK